LSVSSLSTGSPTTIQLPQATTPVDDLLGLLGAPTVAAVPAPSTADRVANGAGDAGSFFRNAAGALVGAS
jgi:hypothetical protein